MENSLEKSRNTSGPFPLPIGHRVGKSKMDFIEYCEFKHSDNMNCALWKDRDGEYLSSELETIGLNISGPFSKIDDQAIYFTCQKMGCEVKCPCSLCSNPPGQVDSDLSNCKTQCKLHFIEVQRDFDKRLHYSSNNVNYSGIPLNCQDCEQNIEEHKRLHSVIHSRCKFCKAYVTKLEGALTLQDCHENEKSFMSLDKRTCKKCYKVFRRSDIRKRHEDTNTCQEAHKQGISKVKKYKCDLCDVEFTENRNLVRHQKVHHEDFQMIKCEECEETFRRASNKERHVCLVHNYVEHNKNPNFPICKASRQYTCEICHGRFKTKFDCIRHKETVHEKENTFQCAHCPMEFLRKDSMQRHSRMYCRLRPCMIVSMIIKELLDCIQ